VSGGGRDKEIENASYARGKRCRRRINNMEKGEKVRKRKKIGE